MIPKILQSVGRIWTSIKNSYNEEKWDRIRTKLGLLDGESWARFGRTANYSGKSVTVDRVLQLSAAWACIRLTAQAISILPQAIYMKTANGGREEITDSREARILTESPNASQTAVEFWEEMAGWLAGVGNSTALIERTAANLSALTPVPFRDCIPVRRNGTVMYRLTDRGKEEYVPRENVLHLRLFSLGGLSGLSPIQYGANTFGASMAVEESAAKFFSNGIQSSIVVGASVGERGFSDQQTDQLQKRLEQFAGSDRAWRALVLPFDLKAEKLTINPEDSQMLETRKFDVEEICRWWNVPSILVGHVSEGTTTWGSGIEQIFLAWLALGINPVLKKIEARVNKQLIPTPRTYFEFNRAALMQMDSKALASFLSTMVQNGLMDRNEARAKINYPARDGGDELTVQVNLTKLSNLGNQATIDQSARNALRAWLDLNDGGSKDE